MLDRPARGAFAAGGIARIAASTASENANVAASTPNVNGKPNAAMQMPASAGPAIAETVRRRALNADTAGSSSTVTSFGVIASSAGRWNPFTADMKAATANSTTTLGCSASEFQTSASEPSSISVSHQSKRRRRSIASAYAPPQSAAIASGTSWTAPRSPTSADDFVMS